MTKLFLDDKIAIRKEDCAMNKQELSAWADALVTLLDVGKADEVRRILKSVILPETERQHEGKKKE